MKNRIRRKGCLHLLALVFIWITKRHVLIGIMPVVFMISTDMIISIVYCANKLSNRKQHWVLLDFKEFAVSYLDFSRTFLNGRHFYFQHLISLFASPFYSVSLDPVAGWYMLFSE